MHSDDKSFFRRLRHGVGGQAYLRGVYLAYTLTLVPVLIRAWGVDLYGTWLVLTALAVYMAVSGSGLSSASTAEMLQAVGANDVPRARVAFQQSTNVIFMLTSATIIPALIVAYFLPLSRLLHLSQISETAVLLILSLMAVQVCAGALRIVLAGAISARGHYGMSATISATAKLFELAMIIVFVAVWRQGPIWAASAVALGSIIDLSAHFIVCHRLVPWARFDFTKIDVSWARKFLGPTLGNFILSIVVSAILIQAPRIVLSAVLGTAAVAVYGVYASVMRLMEQFTGLVSSTLIMEIAREIGRQRNARVATLVTSGAQFVTVCALVVSLGLLVAGPFVFEHWTAGQVHFDYGLIGLFLATGAAIQIGKIGQWFLIGANRILLPSVLMFWGACCGVALGGLLAAHIGVAGMAIGGLVGEVVILGVGIFYTARGIGAPVSQMLLRAIRLDQGAVMAYKRLRAAISS